MRTYVHNNLNHITQNSEREIVLRRKTQSHNDINLVTRNSFIYTNLNYSDSTVSEQRYDLL